MNKVALSTLMILIGLVGGYWVAKVTVVDGEENIAEKQILYWVAPMDESYRKDKPGKSPMGMDLVPVYAEPDKPQKKILYWVAPMDDSYRKDKPGKSPMGMDLVPVYANEGSAEVGRVKINANVENNIGVRTEQVSFEPLKQQIDTVGYIGFDQSKIWHIYPRVEGWVEELLVSAQGDKVVKGAKLFTIYSPTLVNAQEEFLIALKRAKPKVIESSKNRLLSLGVSLAQIKEVEKQQEVAQKVAIYARSSGHITALNIRQGQYVRPEDKLLSLADISTVWVMTEVFERQAAWLKMGLAANMTTDYMPAREWQGRINHIHPFLNQKNRTMRVRLHVDNSDEVLKPNMFVKVSISSHSNEPVIVISSQALIRTGKQDRVVLSLGDGRYQSIAVLVGRQSGDRVEIVKGLKADDIVVTSAHFLLDSESSKTADFSRMQVLGRSDNNGRGR